MQKLSLLLSLFFIAAISLSAQRGEIPETNDNNDVDLKVVFQNYIIVTTHHNQIGGMHTSIEKGKYLQMKVNGLYLKGAETGIKKGMFKKYLGNCPRSLDLGLEGLRNYRTSDRSGKLQWLSYITGIAGGVLVGKYLLQDENDRSNLDRNLGIGLLAGGIATYYAFGYRADKYEELGDQRIVDAFDLYREDCFTGDLNDPVFTADGLGNGDSNENEKVKLDLLSNSSSPSYFFVGPYGLIRIDNGFHADAGLNLQLGVKGININLKAAKSFSPLFDFDNLEGDSELQYYGEALVTLPLIKKENQKIGKFACQDEKGRNFTLKSSEIKYQSSFGVDGGIEVSRGYSEIFDNYNLFLNSNRRIRAGLSLSISTEASFKILDNRFPDRTNKVFTNTRFFFHALIDAGSEVELAPRVVSLGGSVEPDEIPEGPEMGFVGGLEILGSKGGLFGSRTLKLEAGLYPASNNIAGFGAQIGLGFLIGSVSR